MSSRRFRRDRKQQSEREARRTGRLGGRAALAAGVATGAAVLFAPGSAQAASFQVNSTADTVDLDLCGDNDCTLREAFIGANASSGGDTITFASSLSGATITLDGSNGPLTIGGYDVDGGLTIQGPGADQLTISGDNATGIFKFLGFDSAGEDVAISGLTLTEGAQEAGAAIFSYGLYDSGQCSYGADLHLDGLAIVDNYAEVGSALVNLPVSSLSGDCPAPAGELRLTNSRVADNEGLDFGTIVSIGYQSPQVVADSQVVDNTAGKYAAGALAAYGDDVTIARSTISGNAATNGDPSSSANVGGFGLSTKYGSTTVDSSTIANNTADDYMGGVFVTGPGLVTDTTISGNRGGLDPDDDTTDPAFGGLLFREGEGTEARVIDSTIAGNAAPRAGGIALYGDTPAELSSTVVADNTASTAPDLYTYGNGTTTATFAINHSLIENTAGAQIDDAANNIFGADPQLGALQNNGGATQTILPNLGSPLIDAGIANGLSSDQRGQARTFDSLAFPNVNGSDGTDIGATELQPGENGLPANGECKGAPAIAKTGTESGETITGTESVDLLTGAGGDDTLQGLGANDCLSGDAGNDTADGGAGADLITGGAGKDTLKGAGGKDKDQGAGGAARTSSRAAGARTRSPAAGARTRSTPARARTRSRPPAARTRSTPPTARRTSSTAAAARTRPTSTPRTRSRPTATW